MTTRELGALVGTSGPTVSRWENGVNEPDGQMKSKLADVLGCSIAYLMGESENSTDANPENSPVPIPFVYSKGKDAIDIHLAKEALADPSPRVPFKDILAKYAHS